MAKDATRAYKRRKLVKMWTVADDDPTLEDLAWEAEIEVSPSVSFDHGINVTVSFGNRRQMVTFMPYGPMVIRRMD